MENFKPYSDEALQAQKNEDLERPLVSDDERKQILETTGIGRMTKPSKIEAAKGRVKNQISEIENERSHLRSIRHMEIQSAQEEADRINYKKEQQPKTLYGKIKDYLDKPLYDRDVLQEYASQEEVLASDIIHQRALKENEKIDEAKQNKQVQMEILQRRRLEEQKFKDWQKRRKEEERGEI